MRKRIQTCGLSPLLSMGAACGGVGESEVPEVSDGQVSEFGVYEGYSEERFDGWVRSSQYLEVRDGTKLAVDIVRPTMAGAPTDEPLPVIWTHSRYHRTPAAMAAAAADSDGGVVPTISFVDVSPTLQRLLRHGYVLVGLVFAAVARRTVATRASFHLRRLATPTT